MNPEEAVLIHVRNWIEKALEDRSAAQVLERSGEKHWSSALFHCQQCVEKLLKAYLIYHDVDYPKTHDLAVLVRLASSIDSQLAEHIKPVARLTRHAVSSRYPDLAHEELEKDEVFASLQIVEDWTDAIKTRLPDEAWPG